MEHISFGSVESLHNKVKESNKRYHPEQRFGVKPKLHGTNASIVISKDGVYAQSRKNVLTLDQDNAGFARFVDGLEMNNQYLSDTVQWVVYGEWAGEGIQKNDAVTQIRKKAFFVFAVRIILDGGSEQVAFDPDNIKDLFGVLGLIDHPDIYVIPEMGELDIQLSGNVAHLESVENTINAYVAQFEEIDPYINTVFGVEAPGEGVVVYPKTTSWDIYKGLMFKAKTATHSVNKSKKAASAKVQISPDVLDFAERFATVPRFEQAITELGIDTDMKNMGKFLKWVNEDVIKESKDELEESELEWKQCAKQITNRAREWFMTEAKRIT